mgnify:CR=1 FL=1
MQPLYLLCCPCHFGLERTLRFGNLKNRRNRHHSAGRPCPVSRRCAHHRKANLSLSVQNVCSFSWGSFPLQLRGAVSGHAQHSAGTVDRQGRCFPVKGHALDSKLHSVPDCQSILKKAAVERLKSVYHTSWFTESGAIHPLHFTIRKNIATIYLDTSGIGLHKRGYREKRQRCTYQRDTRRRHRRSGTGAL